MPLRKWGRRDSNADLSVTPMVTLTECLVIGFRLIAPMLEPTISAKASDCSTPLARLYYVPGVALNPKIVYKGLRT